jgi:hypothetical protein
MAYGLEVFNSGGFLQISDQYPVQQVISLGTAPFTSTDPSAKVVNLPVPGGSVATANLHRILAWIYPTNPPTGDTGLTTSASCYHFGTQSGVVQIGFKRAGSNDLIAGVIGAGGFRYMLTIEPQYVTNLIEDYGLNIFTSENKLAYTSELALPNISAMSSNDPTTNFTLHSSTSTTHPYFLINSCYPTDISEGPPGAGEPSEMRAYGPLLEFVKQGASFVTRVSNEYLHVYVGNYTHEGDLTTFDRPFGRAVGVVGV